MQKASPISTNSKWAEVHITSSSDMRDKCTMSSAQFETNSMQKSRSPTASRELWQRPSKPRRRALSSRSIGKLVPASAAEPSGRRLMRARASRKRSASRSSISYQASMWWPKVTGCAVCRWVKPGMTVSASRSAMSTTAPCSRRTAATIPSVSSRSMRRRSVTTWSLRERPVWSFLPASPMRRVSADSMFMWTSSSAGFHSKLPASISASMLRSPLDDRRAFRLAQHPHLREHGGMGHGAGDVVAVEAPVEVLGCRETLHQHVGRLAESSAPGLVVRGIDGHRGGFGGPAHTGGGSISNARVEPVPVAGRSRPGAPGQHPERSAPPGACSHCRRHRNASH